MSQPTFAEAVRHRRCSFCRVALEFGDGFLVLYQGAKPNAKLAHKKCAVDGGYKVLLSEVRTHGIDGIRRTLIRSDRFKYSDYFKYVLRTLERAIATEAENTILDVISRSPGINDDELIEVLTDSSPWIGNRARPAITYLLDRKRIYKRPDPYQSRYWVVTPPNVVRRLVPMFCIGEDMTHWYCPEHIPKKSKNLKLREIRRTQANCHVCGQDCIPRVDPLVERKFSLGQAMAIRKAFAEMGLSEDTKKRMEALAKAKDSRRRAR